MSDRLLQSRVQRWRRGRSSWSLALEAALIFFLLVLQGCCYRWSIDDPNTKGFKPELVGQPVFVLELYKNPDFDKAHQSVGVDRISMTQLDLKLVPENYTRSIILKAAPGTALQLTTDNGATAEGSVGAARQLQVSNIFYDAPDASYQTQGNLGCRITDLVIKETGTH